MFQEFEFDKNILGRKRPIGVSGLMRVKDEAEFFSASVDSCINALDELIVVYQKSSDGTEECIFTKQKQFPNKIKVFLYEPEIKSHNLSEQEYEIAKHLPENSVHLLSNYYNYTLSKAKYNFAMKIDADQIYNTEKLKQICDAYRSEALSPTSFKDSIVYHFTRIYAFICIKLMRFHLILPNIFTAKWTECYYKSALKFIQNKKITSTFSGINIYNKDGKNYIPLGDYSNDTFPPFNGIDDHLIFQITTKTYFEPAPMHTMHASYQRCVIERFKLNDEIYKPFGLGFNLVNLGFLWLHIAPLKSKYYKLDYQNKLVDFNNAKFTDLTKSLSNKLFYGHQFWFRFWWNNWDHQSKIILAKWGQILSIINSIIYGREI